MLNDMQKGNLVEDNVDEISTDLHTPVTPSRSPQESGRSGRSSASIRSPRSCRIAGKKSFFLDGSELSEGEEVG